MKAKRFKFTFLFLLAVAGFSAVTMLLWNALLPDLFGIASINFWQALGLLALSRILFSGMSMGAMKRLHRHHHNYVYDKWMNMTPEQRKRFIDRRRHFGFGNPFDRGHFDMGEHEEAGRKND